MLTLAHLTAPYIRFLHPDVVRAIVEDNVVRSAQWRALLSERGIDPDLYLWQGSSCAFPGVRRHAGSREIANHKTSVKLDIVHAQALAVDDNHYPKSTWSYILRGRPFQNQGPQGYALAHIFDHKAYKNRGHAELDYDGDAVVLHGLFTAVTNTCYMPVGLIRPTDFGFALRNLIQRYVAQLYDGIGCLLPAGLAIKSNADVDWQIDKFNWAEPVGTMEHVHTFLEFRAKKVEALMLNVDAASAPSQGLDD